MRIKTVFPNSFTFAGVFSTASNEALGSPENVVFGEQAHTLVIKMGYLYDVFVGTSLMNMYCKMGFVDESRKVFDEMPERSVVSWGAIISGYAMERRDVEAFEMFKVMRGDEEEENEFVFTSVLSALADPELIHNGKQIHCLAFKNGLLSFVSVGNSVVTMYVKCGSVDDAFGMFEFFGDKDSITWSAMITGYAQSGDSEKALKLFSEMHSAMFWPSEFTLVGVLNACSNVGAIREGKQTHCYLLKLRFESQVFIRTALVDMYAKCCSIFDARKEFDLLQGGEVDMVLWTSMIGGYVQNGDNEEALGLYGRMEMEGVLPNDLTMVSLLKACSGLAGLEQGKQIHARTIKYGFGLGIPIGSAISTMYAKCGNLDDGKRVFQRMPWRDGFSWNSMISGLSQNNCGNEALELFEEMRLDDIKPDHVTFVNILTACSRMGNLESGRAYFHLMINKYGLKPMIEHYACMVHILSRAGNLQEAKEFIESVPLDHGTCLWHILLGACLTHHDFDIGAYAGERLIELGTHESSAYILLSGIYAAAGRWEDVERVRKLMILQCVNKEPGCSWKVG
ncbi:hypothetical protein GIB67_010196 [Kingdonia uniflora]|uniref:Pentatricopeptide repeat-containing protein n=1 Tax=Kingdonia uniflora TaxID=39325 RepID=A0A7J7NAP1_9MAGN|nr:hypothetical protein GIB67_010196 [Kingdonia uniflora]